jgi:manganese transport protein
LAHVQQLAGLAHSQLLLLHVADGWAARNFNSLKLAESEEMKADRTYLENTAESLRTAGLIASVQLALGDPPAEIIKTAERENCDLIAMGSHGHKLVGDLVFGSTINKVRHDTDIPVLLVREIK